MINLNNIAYVVLTRSYTQTLHIIIIQGVPKKVSVKPNLELQNLGGVFLGVKNNSKNFGNQKISRLFSKIFIKWTLFVKKIEKIL